MILQKTITFAYVWSWSSIILCLTVQVRLFDAFNYVGNGQILFWTGGTWWCALLCGDGLFMLLFALHAEYISSTRTVRPHFSLLPQLLLVTTRHARERKEQGLALRQEQSGCSRFRSFLYAFWSLRFSFSAAASSFVQDSIENFQKRGFPESFFCRFFWSNQLSQTITRMITKR